MAYTQEQRNQWKANRMLRTEQVVEKLSPHVKPFASIVGVWVWVTFKQKPEQETLDQIKQLGFRWNGKRKAWQHPCGVFRTKSPIDPRSKYGEKPVSERPPEETLLVEKVSAN